MEDVKPSDWCQKQIDEAADGDAAYDYYQLKELWEKRESCD